MKPVSNRSVLRLGFVITSNGILFFFAAQVLLDRSESLYWRLLGLAVCGTLMLGTVLEVGKRKAARVVNVGAPTALGGILVLSSFVWVEPEGAPYVLIFSLLPFFLACIVEATYRLTGPADE
jgi:hypothetical protein